MLRDRGIEDERIGVDRLDAYGFLALQAAGVHLVPAQLAVEQARAVKGPAEIELIRRSVRVCDAAVADLYQALRPGMTENEAWARLLGAAFALGARVRRVPPAVVGAADEPVVPRGERPPPGARRPGGRSTPTSIGPAGYLADLSRTYLVGSTTPSARQRRLYADAQAFLAEIIAELKPGAAFDEVGERLSRRAARRLPRGALPLHRARQRPR